MDRAWIDSNDRLGEEYSKGLDTFIEFALRDKPDGAKIHCPCMKCQNRYLSTIVDVKQHCQIWGFMRWYKKWCVHGESYVSTRDTTSSIPTSDCTMTGDDMVGMVQDVAGINDAENASQAPEDLKEILKLLEEANVELYAGCSKFSSLSFIMRLMHLKVLNGWSNKSVDMLLELLTEAFSEMGVKMPKNYYEASKITNVLGMECKVWDACPNNCMIYRGRDEAFSHCLVCSAHRYKKEGSTIACKRVRYFPLTPRLKRLFMSRKTASLMRWHEEGRVKDGVYRHPSDSRVW